MSGLLPQLEVNCVSSIGRLYAFIVLVEAANSYGLCDSYRQNTSWAIVANINVAYQAYKGCRTKR